ncbi:conserved hypothetical protein [Gammaproteobacteria bacterium]
MADNDYEIIEGVLGTGTSEELWSNNYFPVIPFSIQDFSISALLPSMLYMARFGHRRGRGHFEDTFGKKASISNVAKELIRKSESNLVGFDDQAGTSVLGDLLLASCLENQKSVEGQQTPVQRVYPTHYLASWVDLPVKVSSLRGVPEFLSAVLANQSIGEWIEPSKHQGNFQMGVGFSKNVLLSVFGRAMEIDGYVSNFMGDQFIEKKAKEIGVEELLAVRLGQACGGAPKKSAKSLQNKNEGEKIPNRHPLARQAGNHLRKDLSILIRAYGTSVPRKVFLEMLESAISLGLSNLILSTAKLLEDWERTGEISDTQPPWPVFVDGSNGTDSRLRNLSEASMEECIRRYERTPIRMTILKILDIESRLDEEIEKISPVNMPDSVEWIRLLGEIFHKRHPRSKNILEMIGRNCRKLALEFEKEFRPEIVSKLRNNALSPALNLAEVINSLRGNTPGTKNMDVLSSALASNEPNGISKSRSGRRTQNGVSSNTTLRSIVLQPPLLEFLVHRHVFREDGAKQFLSLQGLLRLLRENYGLYVDCAPPGQPISQDLLLKNKKYVEDRLRDLGLLLGVNDAESMKQIKPHYVGAYHV